VLGIAFSFGLLILHFGIGSRSTCWVRSGIAVIVVSSWLVGMQMLQAWVGQGVVDNRRLAIGGLHIAIFWGWRSTWGYVLELYVGQTLVLKRILVQI
jgi:hypothetical protein